MEVHQHPETKHYIVTLEDRCKGCGLCIQFCPKDCLDYSDDFNDKGWRVAKMHRMKDCIKCYMCERMCPDFAIYIDDSDVKKKSKSQK
ncbi:MAG: 4Fe-4S dicluster domain-containing protein [Candidatus Heimdallarchaeota archaeon]